MIWYNSDIYSKAFGSWSQYHIDEQALNNAAVTIDFPATNNNSASFRYKEQIRDQSDDHSTKNIDIMAPLKYLSNFWRNLGNAIN